MCATVQKCPGKVGCGGCRLLAARLAKTQPTPGMLPGTAQGNIRGFHAPSGNLRLDGSTTTAISGVSA